MFGICVFDDSNERVLSGYYFSSPKMTVELCLSTCRSKGFPYSGLQWEIECYCGIEPAKGFEWAWQNKCHDKCAGNSNQICGGPLAMSVYSTLTYIDGQCIFDFPAPYSVLTGYSITGNKNMTIETCKGICSGSDQV